MKKRFSLFGTFLFFVQLCVAQSTVYKDSVVVESKIWSRDSNRNIQYSGWKPFAAHTVDMLDGFKPSEGAKISKYGGDASITEKATGFFRTALIKGRWMVIDPEGHPFVVVAINSIRQGKSENNEKAFLQKFGTVENWMSATVKTCQQLGFNTAGSWSETAPIIEYNKAAEHPFAYTTQLNLLSGYARVAIKKNPLRKKNPILSFVLDEEFVAYCDEQAKKLVEAKNDPNLLGHFSDNELAFMVSEFKDLASIEDKSDKCLVALQQWMKEKGVDSSSISKDQKEAFIASIAGAYFKTVSSAIKKYDPNHMYIGSRLHSTAKKNAYLFAAADPYVDIMSINYYGYWKPEQSHMAEWAAWSTKPFFITEFYTKAEDAGMTNMSGAGWLVKTQADRGIHYQNFCLQLLKAKNCVGWHWFRYQDNDPSDKTADASNSDSNKGIVNTSYDLYEKLADKMKQLNTNAFSIIKYWDSIKK